MTRSFVSPGRYVQGRDILSTLGTRTTQFGERALLIADETVLSIVREDIEQSFAEAACDLTVAQFGGECTASEIDRLTARARDTDVDVVLGAGGGKTLDTAKSVRAGVDGAMVSVPTAASTDAPTSGVSVLYEADGAFDTAQVHDRRPDLVVVDTTVVANAPTRLFVSGIGDALATAYEAKVVATGEGTTPVGDRPTRAGTALAEQCGNVLRERAADAVAAVERDEVTPAVEDVTEAIVLLSGLGFENGGLAAAHAIHDGLSTVLGHDVLHGERVSIGLLAQLVLEGRSEAERREVASFAATVGLPTTPSEINLDVTDDRQVTAVAEAACRADSPMSNMPETVSPDAVADALKTLGSHD